MLRRREKYFKRTKNASSRVTFICIIIKTENEHAKIKYNDILNFIRVIMQGGGGQDEGFSLTP